MAGSTPDRLLGVRDAFIRYLHEGLRRPTSVAVVPHPGEEMPVGLPLTDEETMQVARRRAEDLRRELGDTYHFYVASEGGLEPLELGSQVRYFVRNWSVVISSFGEAWGSSGSVQLPERLVAGLSGEEIPTAVPGTRRRGGIISSLTGGLETRRRAVALSTLHALSTLFYGVLETRGLGR